ncbi:MAG: hypothetical protein ACJA1L_000752 [Paracoccaceae bacterium]|jgi:hypothetical protein
MQAQFIFSFATGAAQSVLRLRSTPRSRHAAAAGLAA